ncbi:ATP-binding cassette domain-containing protein [Kineosporia sp. R_H_3]|uniref:ATP-binding cassette domain-containing protein n=1 Tax=Kineosporia sp. R_H_3 TaxID=1961848 RepID=UPI000B4B0966|nr:ATP-binding cassette domain-containing protein [Kineosporia sp. R_H_3]
MRGSGVDGTAIEASGLVKRYAGAAALDGVDLAVRAGTVCALLGPNGAGKTTAVRVLTTLLRPDAGTARVAGADVLRESQEVRRRIGVSGQEPAVDEILGGRQNLVMFARLLGYRPAAAAERADALLDRFGLAGAGAKQVKHYSGGMRRRLDLAVTLLLAPQVLFLDEPTTGLDPRNRNEVWAAVRGLVAGGTTVLLTTQYLDEADRLADEVVVMDEGRVIAAGTPAALKARVGGERLEVVVRDAADLAAATAALAEVCDGPPEVDADAGRVGGDVARPVAALGRVLSTLTAAGVEPTDIGLRRPTLDDVFLRITGHRTGPRPDRAAEVADGTEGTDGAEVAA